jgi:hypothetical protein
LKVSSSPDGPPDYLEGKDWRHNPDYENNRIDWSRAGREPPVGSTYYVTYASGQRADPTKHVVAGRAIVLPTPLSKDQAVFVAFVYGSRRSGNASLTYQQTSAGDGGFNSIFIDTTYSSRYLGKHIAMGLDWLDDYKGLDAGLKREAMDLLVRWSDYLRDHGYHMKNPESNYAAGAYVSNVLTALALRTRHPAGPRLVSDVLRYRARILVPLLEAPSTSLKGGFWVEGWSYGFPAALNELLAGLALEDAGLVRAGAERKWAAEVTRHLLSAQPARDRVYDGGEWFTYPARFLDRSLFCVLAAAAEDAPARSYANYVLKMYTRKDFVFEPRDDYLDLLFYDPRGPASFWRQEPLHYFAPGAGLLTARSDWGPSPTWVSVQIGNLLHTDHQTETPGQVQICRGDDDLLINAVTPGNLFVAHWSDFGNIVVIDDNGDGLQRFRFKTGLWYGKPGVVVRACETADRYTYVYGDCHAAYSSQSRPGGGGPAKEWTRQVVYLLPNHVVVYDRVTTLKASYVKQQRWHFLRAPEVAGTSFAVSSGKSRLFGQVFSTTPLKATAMPIKAGRAVVHRLMVEGAPPTEKIRYVTAFQVAAAGGQRDPARHVLSKDGRMEGVQMGASLTLFGREEGFRLRGPLSYDIEGKAPVQHLVANLEPGARYAVRTNGAEVTSVVASGQGTIFFTTTPDGTQTVTVAPAAK